MNMKEGNNYLSTYHVCSHDNLKLNQICRGEDGQTFGKDNIKWHWILQTDECKDLLDQCTAQVAEIASLKDEVLIMN